MWGEDDVIQFSPSTGAEKMHLRRIPKSRMSRKFYLPLCIYVDNLFARCPREFL